MNPPTRHRALLISGKDCLRHRGPGTVLGADVMLGLGRAEGRHRRARKRARPRPRPPRCGKPSARPIRLLWAEEAEAHGVGPRAQGHEQPAPLCGAREGRIRIEHPSRPGR